MAGCEKFPVGRECQAIHLALMPLEVVYLLAALHLPDKHVGIPAISTPCDQPAIRRDGNDHEPLTFARPRIVGLETPYFLARSNVPQQDAAHVTGDDTLAVGREAQRVQ